MIAKPKKIGSMKQMMKYFGLTAMAVMGLLACTRAQVEQPVQKTITLTTTINLGEDEDSKALSALGVKTFAVGEQVAVIYAGTYNSYTGKVVSAALKAEDIYDNGKKARITVALPSEGDQKAQNGGMFRMIYPASMAADGDPTVIHGDGNLKLSALGTQDGTLSSLANNLDLCVYDGYLETINNTAAFPSSISLTNRLAICEFNVFVGGVDKTNTITKLTLTNGSNTYTINRAASAGPIYVAVQPVTSGNIEITANDLYIKTISGKTLAAGKMYPIRLGLPPTVNLATLNGNYTAKDGETLAGTLGDDYRIIIPAGATVTLQNVSINANKSMSSVFPGIKCEGSATLILVGNNVVNGRHQDYAGIYPGPAGSTLTIQGNGSLSASSGAAPGIGSSSGDSSFIHCGNIVIEGGTIVASGGGKAPGIGSGAGSDTSQDKPSCGAITITSNVTRVTVSKGANEGSVYSIGPGPGGSTCGTVTVGGINVGYITTSPYIYAP